MKIAVSAKGKERNSPVDPRFGRAPWFVILDSDTGEVVDALDNTAARDAAHGAGINAATVVAEAGVGAVLTGKVGPKAFAVLDSAGIKVISGVNGTVSDALELFRSGGVRHDQGPAADGHSASPAGAGQSAARGGGQGRGYGGGGRGAGGGRGEGGCGCGRRGR